MRLVKILANLGYGSRREVEKLVRGGYVTNREGVAFSHKDQAEPGDVLIGGEELDPWRPLTIVMNKPTGFVCSKEDEGETVYELLPGRYELRNPGLNPVGRLDKDTSGLLLLSDDGKLLHRIIHPKSGCLKVYEVEVARDFRGDEEEIFGSGEFLLENEVRPLLAAGFKVTGTRKGIVTLHEGRYHQVRRMFAALGNHVEELRRVAIGGLELPGDLAEGEWRVVTDEELASVFSGDGSKDIDHGND